MADGTLNSRLASGCNGDGCLKELVAEQVQRARHHDPGVVPGLQIFRGFPKQLESARWPCISHHTSKHVTAACMVIHVSLTSNTGYIKCFDQHT